jgi:prolyl oligopeptidase
MIKLSIRFIALALVISQAGFSGWAQEHKAPPSTRVDNVTETIHGVTITDPYRWLEDQNSPDTRAWINAQNDYTRSMVGSFPGRNRIHQRLEQLMKVEAIDTPFERGGRYFKRSRRADQNQFVIYVRTGLAGKDEVLIDGNTLSADQNTSANLLDVSADGKYMATRFARAAKTKSVSMRI